MRDELQQGDEHVLIIKETSEFSETSRQTVVNSATGC